MKVTFDLPEELVNSVKDIVGGIVKDYEKIWPKKGDTYWYITDTGCVCHDIYYAAYSDDVRKELGNFFKTKQEAMDMLEYLKVLHELKELADDDQVWDDMTPHYTPLYDASNNKIIINCAASFINGAYYFKSKESAQAAIDKIGEERLEKYYFNIEEADENENYRED